MNIRTGLRVAAVATAALQVTMSSAFGIGPGSIANQTETVGACVPAEEFPTGHDTLVDINTAPRDWLVWVGIDQVLADKIIGSRPFQTRNELLIRGILPRETYDKVKDRIIARHV